MRTWQTAHKMKAQRGAAARGDAADAQRQRPRQALRRQVHDQPGDRPRHRARGRLDRARQAGRPGAVEAGVLRRQAVADAQGRHDRAAAMGDPNASIPTPQPVHYRPMFGAFGGGARALVADLRLAGGARRRRAPTSSACASASAPVRGTPRDRQARHGAQRRHADDRGRRRRPTRCAPTACCSPASRRRCCRWRSATSCSDGDRRADAARRQQADRRRRRPRAGAACAARRRSSSTGTRARRAASTPSIRQAGALGVFLPRGTRGARRRRAGRRGRLADRASSAAPQPVLVVTRTAPSTARRSTCCAPPTTSATATCRSSCSADRLQLEPDHVLADMLRAHGPDRRRRSRRRSSPKAAPTTRVGTRARPRARPRRTATITITTTHRRPRSRPRPRACTHDHGMHGHGAAMTRATRPRSTPLAAAARCSQLMRLASPAPAGRRLQLFRRAGGGGRARPASSDEAQRAALARSTSCASAWRAASCRRGAAPPTPGARDDLRAHRRAERLAVATPRDRASCAQQTRADGPLAARSGCAIATRPTPRLAALAALQPAPTWPVAFALAGVASGAPARATRCSPSPSAGPRTWCRPRSRRCRSARAPASACSPRSADAIPAAVDAALRARATTTQAFTPMLAILAARHETQYSRLFRS